MITTSSVIISSSSPLYLALTHCFIGSNVCCRLQKKWVSNMHWEKARAWSRKGGGTGWMFLALCVFEGSYRSGLCAWGHLEKHTHIHIHTFCSWHHSLPCSKQECYWERRSFVEERKEMGGEEKEEKKRRKRLGQENVWHSHYLEQDGDWIRVNRVLNRKRNKAQEKKASRVLFQVC